MQYFIPAFNPRGHTIYGNGTVHPIGYIQADGSFMLQFNQLGLDYPRISFFQTIDELMDMKGIPALGLDQYKGIFYAAHLFQNQVFRMETSDRSRSYPGTDALIPIVGVLHEIMKEGLVQQLLLPNVTPKYIILGGSGTGTLGINNLECTVRTRSPISSFALLLWDADDKINLKTQPASAIMQDYDITLNYVDETPGPQKAKKDDDQASSMDDPERLSVFEDFLGKLDLDL